VEDLHEALVGTVPGISFGLAFCESSGACLVRWSGTDPEMIGLAKVNALALSAGHSFIIFLKAGFFCRGSTLFPTPGPDLFPTFSVLDYKTIPAGMSTLITELFTSFPYDCASKTS